MRDAMELTEQGISPHIKRRSFIQSVRKGIAQFGLWIGFALLVGCFVLAELHLIDTPHVTILVLAGLMVILSEQVHDVWHSLEAHQKEEDHELSKFNRQLSLLNERIGATIASPQLSKFGDCMADLLKRIKEVKPNERLVIEHFGLDIYDAWDQMATALSTATNLRNITYRLIMMDGEPGEIPPDYDHGASGLEGWRAMAGHRYNHLLDTSNLHVADFKNRGCKLEFTVRRYLEAPVLHGIRILEPASIAVSYVGMCRWKGNKWQVPDWGKDSYQIIDPASACETTRDLVQVFSSHFQHHFYADILEGNAEGLREKTGLRKSPK
jgi:hypothetical protein